jgi:inorganic pyrophosphatase
MPNLEKLPIGDDAPHVVNVVVEAPVGSRNKYEYDADLGVVARDRVLPGAVRYPADYGFIPSTVAADGDPLDVFVAAYDGAFPGCVLRARPIGALALRDASGEERTVLAVPDDDPRFADIRGLEDIPSRTCARSRTSSPPTSGSRATTTSRSVAGGTSRRRTS